ncbi:accessory Sec system S-layer assembly protein [Metabacillus halosaccharovorans]|uniref:accessory Sec system S-layer assembly protein n=1 Tax=Metabacillus halosaccharovorans TaxID=930124 RepID=UPI001FE921CD|nr:accessory Sec system S-layer assembly protein [Metabacillus halosaccharovorans]
MTTNTVETTLSIHPSWNITKQEQYIYQFHLNQLESLKENQISIAGIKLEEFDELIYVTALIRNTLSKAIKFEMLDLLILDEEKKVIAKETFDMDEFGEMPALSCRPWSFVFQKSAWQNDEIQEPTSLKNWQIAFELKKKPSDTHQLQLEPSWEENLSQERKDHLKQLVEKMPPLTQNEVNIMGLEAKMNEENNLVVTLLIRNGSLNNINIEQLPLLVEDASKEVVAKGVFTLNNLEILANTSKPWSFIFPSQLLSTHKPDLSTWKVYPLTNQAANSVGE